MLGTSQGGLPNNKLFLTLDHSNFLCNTKYDEYEVPIKDVARHNQKTDKVWLQPVNARATSAIAGPIKHVAVKSFLVFVNDNFPVLIIQSDTADVGRETIAINKYGNADSRPFYNNYKIDC